MLKWEFDNRFNFRIENEDYRKIALNQWKAYEKEHLNELAILNEFRDNGFAEESDYYLKIETEAILNLSDVDKACLNLPDSYPFVIYIEPNGILHQSTFTFKYGFYDFAPNGNRIVFEKNGPILKSESNEYILSINQYKILEAIDSFNNLPEATRTFHNNLKSFANLKGLTESAGLILDEFLTNQNVIEPERIKIEPKFHNDILELLPIIDGVDQDSFIKGFDRNNKVKGTYSTKNEKGETVRVIIDKKKKKELEEIKDKRKVSDKNLIEDIAENPEAYFNEDIIDIQFFSERVREIGIYKPKFYPFVSPYKSEWIPGISIRDKVDGEKRIHFKTKIELAEFEKEKEHAKSRGETEFEYREEKISIENAENFIEVAKRQFANPKEPAVSKNKDNDDPNNQVLIIKENAEILEHIENEDLPESIDHKFSSVPNLKGHISLKDHQKEGVAWLQTLFKNDYHGCLLADDMGLGKTLQLLYFIEWHAQHTTHNKPYLIVAPVSLLENWQSEYEKFFDPSSLEVLSIHGNPRLGKKFSKDTVDYLQSKKVILTNYESLRAYQLNLCAVDYSLVILDEAQKIKTPGTLITNVSKAIKADFKVAMTGTPVENTLVDLWCIMDFSVPGLLGNAKEFSKNYQKPLKNEETDIVELGEKLRASIGVFIKRRLKSQVAKDLPKKETKIIKKVMPQAQFDRYMVEIEASNREDLEGIERRNQILKSLWAIRDISDHPYLVDKQINLINSIDLIKHSAKLQSLIEILEEIKNKNEKAIIFADRRDTQKMLKKVIFDILNIPPPSIINGDTPSTQRSKRSSKLSRQQTIDRFQNAEGFNVIIMSQLAAGVGLNVTKANHVIHYSRHWNPAKESQATDRAYRIGQTKDVTVYYPMAIFPKSYSDDQDETPASFDEILHDLLERKQNLATNTLFPSEQSEVKPDELFTTTFKSKKTNLSLKPLNLNDLKELTPKLFEAYVAALYNKMGYKVYLTPLSSDRGVDVVAINGRESFIIQAKQSNSILGNGAIQEVTGAKTYYDQQFKENFKKVVFTNNFLGDGARVLADSNEIRVIDNESLSNLLIKFPINIQEVYKCESQRMNII